MGGRDFSGEIEAVYRRRYGRFLRVAVAILRDEPLAEEAVQTLFVRALHPIPMFDQPYLSVTDATHASPFRRGVGTYVPPPGAVFIAAGGRTGFVQQDGLQIGIDAGSEAAVLAAARALAPLKAARS